jgi:hypothetical protein
MSAIGNKRMRSRDPALDPRWEDYRHSYQCAFSLRRKRLGAYATFHARRYVSQVRAMRRQLARGLEPSFSKGPSVGYVHARDFIERRKDMRLRAALNRRHKAGDQWPHWGSMRMRRNVRSGR